MRIKKLLLTSIIFSFIFSIHPVLAAGKTLGDYKREVQNYKAQQEEVRQLTTEAKANIDAKRNAITKANADIAQNETKVEEAKVKVTESQEKIKIKTAELGHVLQSLQYTDSNSDATFIEYVFNSESISDLMERQAIVQEIADYTQQELNDLNDLVKENQDLQVTLTNENAMLNDNITKYEKDVQDLQAYINSKAEIGINIQEKLKALQESVKIYEEAGCKDNDSIDICYYSKHPNSSYFSKPLYKGVVTQAFSYNGYSGHTGIDIGGNTPGTPVYAPANGTVIATVYHSSCGGNIIYMHFNVNGVAYSAEFGHLRSMNVQKGQFVTKGTQIGTVGGDPSTYWYDKCSAGAHLHYAIAYGYYLGSGAYGYSSWSTWKRQIAATGVQSITGIKNVYGYRWTGL